MKHIELQNIELNIYFSGSKRVVDSKLRKSIEEQKKQEPVSSDEEPAEVIVPKPSLKKGKKGKKKKGVNRVTEIKEESVASPAATSDAPSEVSRADTNTPPTEPKKKPQAKKKSKCHFD